MTKVLSKGDIEVKGPEVLDGPGSGTIVIKDRDTRSVIVVNFEEAEFLVEALTQLMAKSSNPPVDQL